MGTGTRVHLVGLAVFATARVTQPGLAFSRSRVSLRKPIRNHHQIGSPSHRLLSQSSRFVSNNLWSIEECMDEWNNQDARTAAKIQFVDATWFHKGERNGRKEFERGPRLPGAFHWDTGDMSTSGDLFPESNPLNLKNVFPPEWMVGLALEKMGVTPTTTLVVYGREGTLFTPRVWYLLKRYFRSGKVKIMQGSLEEWIAKGGRVDEKSTKSVLVARDLLQERTNEDWNHPLISSSARSRLVDKEFVQNVVEKRDDSGLPSVIIDTRGSSFAENGHIPGAKHLPYASLCLADDPLTLRHNLEEIVKGALGNDSFEKLRTEPALLTCGTGVSVCTMALALEELGFPEPWIYDGSWDEWGKDPSTPKAGGISQKEES